MSGYLFNRGDGTSLRERFEVLVQPHFDAMYAAAWRMTRARHDAEDLIQEVCIKVLDHLDDLEEMEHRRAWLLRVVYNEFVDGLRRNRRSPVALADGDDDTDMLTADDPQPDELVQREQQFARVIDAMRFLDPDDCALLAMYDIEGLSIAELCRASGMPQGTVKARLHRTRTRLGRLLYNDRVQTPPLKVIGGES
jgi:RNA polymerase sigma-70 factor (ECF subfamily)